jgi:glycosyltransferase involved in cell wall biosynthesis
MKEKIVIILNRLVIGGQAVDTIPLAYYLQAHFDILILYGQKETDEEEALFLLQQYPGLQLKKIKQLRRTINPFTDAVAFFLIWKAIRQYKARIVHTHGSKSGVLGRLAAKMLGIPVIIHTFHGHLFHSYYNSIGSRLICFAERQLAKITTAIIALSNEQYKELTETFAIVPARKTRIIQLGVDEKIFALSNPRQTAQYRERYGLQPHTVAIGIVGRIVPIKNHLMFLQAAKAFVQKHPQLPVKFLIVGDGEQRKELYQWLQQQQMPFDAPDMPCPGAQVVFTSWANDMATVYHSLDVVVLTSFNEGTPLSIIEAQFCSKPVIATNVGGVKDTFANGVSGLLIESNHPQQLVTALYQLVQQAPQRMAMGQAGISIARQRFSKQNEVKAMQQLYLECITAKGVNL